jgi:hypothetical protein
MVSLGVNRRVLLVMSLVAAAHFGILALAASRYVPPPKPEIETVRVLTGHVSESGELVATGYALARVKIERGGGCR